MSVNQRHAVQKKSYLIGILQIKILSSFEPLYSLLCFLLLLLISPTERLSSFWSLERFKCSVIGFFFNERERREKLLEQWKERSSGSNGFITICQSHHELGVSGEYKFQEKNLVFILASLWKSCRKLSQELQSYYRNGSSSFALWNLKVKKAFFSMSLWK